MERVTVVETKMTTIEARLGAVETSLSSVGSGDLVAFQKQMLVSLRAVRAVLRDEETARAAAAAPAGQTEALLEENAALKKEVSKLNYRIEHLLRHIPAPSAQ
ncbi:Aste57867_2054 [Aphanomyces stellatus]|uniref:Aste57867_2054 protein n=1 Tax=Aphanomyces stellatus TaxID=120398 RepID=A0A485K837_9STRA|nr:hypothetical protein As57867_002050 [Aphanomyces stellatus]VFT79258.1 Aste57867_2054 [Aphanomyces stellatus]